MAKVGNGEDFRVRKEIPVQKKVEAAKPARKVKTASRIFREPQPVVLKAEKKVIARKPAKTPLKVKPFPELRTKLMRAERMDISPKKKRKLIDGKLYRPGSKFFGIRPVLLKPIPVGRKIASPLPQRAELPVSVTKASVAKVTQKDPPKPSYLWLLAILGLVAYVVVK